MAKIYHGAGHDDTSSPAEEALFERFKALPPEYTVFHSVPWITHPSKRGTVGEADFIIAHPSRGLLVTEVKGGLIDVKQGNWTSTSRSGKVYDIKDPCQQADRSVYNLQRWLQRDRRTSGFSYAIYPLVILPDSHVAKDIRPDCPRDIIIDMGRVETLEQSISAAYDYWEGRYGGPNKKVMDGKKAVTALVDLLVPSMTLSPPIALAFERERQAIERLTQRQYRTLNRLRKFHRAAIVGGAGTGKTLLAMEKAQQLATAGMKVLIVCFNKPLSDFLEQSIEDPNITVCTYHSLAGQAIHWAKLGGSTFRDDSFYEQVAERLMDALEVIQKDEKAREKHLFDAVLVDEAQDFEEEWWIPVPDLLKDKENGILYVFFDDNQRIYQQISNIPMDERPFYLDENCRTTQAINRAMTKYAKTDDEVVSYGPEGRPVEHIPAEGEKATREAMRKLLHRLVNQENVAPEDIIVLTPTRKRSMWEKDEMMGNLVLTWDMDTIMNGAIRVQTIHSFKGLEEALVILTELDKLREDNHDELIYVGLSRARHHVVVIGDFPEPQAQTEEE
jgi:superfamily I DNA/RNA helicase